MARQDVHPRSPFASRWAGAGRGSPAMRPRAARPWSATARILVAPLAAVLAAVAGLVYVLLLPICGIASIASAVAKACWAALGEALPGARPRAARPR
jgi:hypothetical protein